MHRERTWKRGEYSVSTERERLDISVIHGFLSRSYWAAGIPRSVVERSLEHSLPFGLYHDALQIGLARVTSDFATFAYLSDVFVLEEYRGKGLSEWLLECIIEYPDLQGLRRWLLMTRDAHGLYQKVGFERTRTPEKVMERYDENIYRR